MTSENPSRDTAGRFRPGHGGRPRGSRNKRKTYSPEEFSNSVDEQATEKLEGLLDKAVGVIDKQLRQGSLKAAIWVLDRALPDERSKLSQAIPDADMTSLEGIIQAAQTTSQMVADGLLGLDAANRFMTILTNCAQLRGYLELKELREMVEEFEKEPAKRLPLSEGVVFPTWGNLGK